MSRLVRWSSPIVGLALIGTVGLSGAERAAAQDATPATGAGTVACTVEPRATDELLTIWFGTDGTPVAPPMSQEPLASEGDAPGGTPADEAITEAVNETMHEIFACFDSAQYARAFALMTDIATRMFGPDLSNPDEDTPEEVRALLEAQESGTPTADEETQPATDPTPVSDARDVRVLDDGRVGAIFESEGDAIFAFFVQEGDTWLLDDLVDIIEGENGTPVAG